MNNTQFQEFMTELRAIRAGVEALAKPKAQTWNEHTAEQRTLGECEAAKVRWPS
jgi:hypothetical protein